MINAPNEVQIPIRTFHQAQGLQARITVVDTVATQGNAAFIGGKRKLCGSSRRKRAARLQYEFSGVNERSYGSRHNGTFNVALSRAQDLRIVIGNANALSLEHDLKKLQQHQQNEAAMNPGGKTHYAVYLAN